MRPSELGETPGAAVRATPHTRSGSRTSNSASSLDRETKGKERISSARGEMRIGPLLRLPGRRGYTLVLVSRAATITDRKMLNFASEPDGAACSGRVL